MARYLLDTNIVSEPLQKSPARSVLDRLEQHGPDCATAAPVIHELRYGIRLLKPSRRRELLEVYLEGVVLQLYPVLPYDLAAAEWHAEERARLARSGSVPPFTDGVIAAVAAANGLVVVTANVRDFRRFRGLEVEDWTA